MKEKKQYHFLKWLMSKFGLISLIFNLNSTAIAKVQEITETTISYNNQLAWAQIEQFLPTNFHIPKDQLPQEEWWDWQGHNIHLDTYRNPQAKIKVILFHGVGTNGRQMTIILGKPLADRNYETIAIDLPSYGLTQVKKGTKIKYDDWVQVGSDLINHELAKDQRPIVLYGLSAGGMLTYHVAAKNKNVKAIVGMTFLDTQSKVVRNAVARNWFMSRVGSPMAHLTAKTPLGAMRIPMRWASKMSALVNNKDALKVFLNDKTSAGNSVTVHFLDSYLNYKPEIAPEDFDICPVLLTQPAVDHWTPLNLSTPFLNRIKKVPVTMVMLENAGHYPLEQPGLDQMVNAIDGFYKETIN